MKRFVFYSIPVIIMMIAFTACSTNDNPITTLTEPALTHEVVPVVTHAPEHNVTIQEPVVENNFSPSNPTTTYEPQEESLPQNYDLDGLEELDVAVTNATETPETTENSELQEPHPTPYQPNVINEVDIVLNGHQLAEEFLRGLPSLFSGYYIGWRDMDTGNLHVWDRFTHQWIETDNLPSIFLGGTPSDYFQEFVFTGNYYDINGDWLLTDTVIYANTFSLYDFDGNGIYDIVVDYIYFWSSSMWLPTQSVLFRYIDGEYQEVGSFNQAHNFYTDPNGEVVLRIENEHDGVFGYYYVRFSAEGMQLESALPDVNLWELGYNTFEHYQGYDWDNITMIVTGIPLARIPPLTDMKEEIATSIRQSLINETGQRSTIPVFENQPSETQAVG